VAVPEVDIATFAERHAAGAAVVDVREPDEYSEAHVAGARLIPLGEIVERAAEVPSGETVYMICARGGRSLRAAEHLQGLGRDVVNVAGGTLEWIDSGHPTVAGDAPG